MSFKSFLPTQYLAPIVCVLMPFLLASKCTSKSETSHQIRCAFDIGSGATKLKVAEVNRDIQTQKIILESKTDTDGYVRANAYAASFDESTGEFAKNVKETGIAAVQAMIAQAKADLKKMGKKTELKCIAVGSAIFRRALAKNPNATQQFLDRFENTTKVKIHIVDQREEALLGFYGAVFSLSKDKTIDPSNILMWDIGATSMQFSGRGQSNKKYLYFGGKQASEPTFQLALKLRGLPADTSSPNPIGPKVRSLMEKELTKIADEVPASIRTKLAKPETLVIGVGPLHRYSIFGQAGQGDSGIYTKQGVENAIAARISLGDSSIIELTKFGKVLTKKERAALDGETIKKLTKKSKYARTDVGNLILVHAYMKNLGIDKVRTVKANLTEGALIKPKYWN